MARPLAFNMAVRIAAFTALAMLTAIVVLTARAMVNDSGNSSPGLSVSWVKDYESLEEMLLEPGAVAVIGQVIARGASYPVGDGVPFTDSIVRVDRVLFGDSLVEPGQNLTVHQTGGTAAGRTIQIEDARLLHRDEAVLLFLVYDPVPQSYVIIGGPHGHYSIKGTGIEHANLTGGDGLAARHGGRHPLALLTENRTVEDVAALVEAAGAPVESR